MRPRSLLPLALLLCPALAVADDSGRLPKAELDKLLAQTDDIAKTVSEIRGLPLKKPITRGIMSKEEVTKRLIERLDEDYKPGEIATEAQALKRFGMLPADLDYRQTMLDVLTEQIAGFYDPQVKELYIADWIDASMQKIVLAHEIDHALQDQSFDLVKFVKPNRENGDAQIARQALVEGDGVALMIEYLFKEQGMKNDPWGNDAIANALASATGLGGGKLLDQAPLFMRESLLFSYVGGLRFVGSSRKTHPWSDIDGMYTKPPASTEQILHPDKYRSGEKPASFKLPTLPSLKTWKRPYNNVIGELGFSLFFRQHGIEKARAEKAAAGWGGDSIMVFAPAADTSALDELVGVSFSTWDADMDAVEAQEAAAATLLPLTKAQAHSEKTATYAAAKDAAGNLSFVERHGRDLLYVVGAPPALAPKLRAEAWAKWSAVR